MKNIRLLIVDDEPLAHNLLESYCNKIDYLTIAGHCYDGLSTLNFLHDNAVDAILLDIQMPDLTGLELLDTLQKEAPKIIFTTAYTEFALQSFDYDQVVDYLHKPIRLTRFIKAIERLKKIIQIERLADTSPVTTEAKVQQSEFLLLKDNNVTYRILPNDIVYCQSYGNYLKIFLTSGELHLIRQTIKATEQLLSRHDFIRIHKSYLINVRRIKQIIGNHLWVDNHRLPVGKTYRQLVKDRILN